MIGLGSNRLSVCRRGGMSVTQAGRGGMEWLAGGRVPDWVTPYSAQATAALKAQFPTQWPTIRDYGFAHPEIVGYMNAYAPEDAKIAYSLVPGLGWRYIKADNACIDSGITPTVTMRYRLIGKRKASTFAGARHVTFGGVCLGNNFVDFFPNSPSSSTRWRYETAPELALTELIIENKHCRVFINNELFAENTFTNSSATTTSRFQIFNINDGNTNPELASSDMHIAIVELDNHTFIPFKLGVARSADQVYPSSKGAQAVGTLGMLDLITGKFHPNAASSGAFTESIETPAS